MKTIYSLGHSTRSLEEFEAIIQSINFDYVIDVRTSPYSRFVPHFNKHVLEKVFGKKYLFMGRYLGGLENDLPEERFIEGIEFVCDLAETKKVVLFCSEKDYKKCHRHLKLEPELRLRGFDVTHL
jgi:uncharacterized protein (DUF488 family)